MPPSNPDPKPTAPDGLDSYTCTKHPGLPVLSAGVFHPAHLMDKDGHASGWSHDHHEPGTKTRFWCDGRLTAKKTTPQQEESGP